MRLMGSDASAVRAKEGADGLDPCLIGADGKDREGGGSCLWKDQCSGASCRTLAQSYSSV